MQVALDLLPRALEPALRIDLLDEQPAVQLHGRAGVRADRYAERVTERVRRVGREHQGLAAARRGQRRGAGGDSGLADPALAGEEEEAQCYPSTRFFNSFRAVSMMTFSALRLIMPSIGILTSTASW